MPTRTAPESFALVVGHTLYQGPRRFSPTEAWAPSVNIYHLAAGVEIAVDLAGVHRDQVDVRIEPGRLLIRGVRAAPEPPRGAGGESMRIVTMEIDYGPFSRSIEVPHNVDLRKVNSEYREGILWVSLPFRQRGRQG